jgi:transcriptional regulator with XRE-family HTH domain
MADRAAVGLALRDVRESAGMTLVQLAEMLGITKSSLSRAELGERDIALQEFMALEDVTGVTYADFRTLVEHFAKERLHG